MKCLGHGLGYDLQRLSFVLNSDSLEKTVTVTSSELYIDNQLAQNWAFEESLLDEGHCVCSAIKGQQGLPQLLHEDQRAFSFLECPSILEALEPLKHDAVAKEDEWANYFEKVQHKPF